jgi:Kef-type K+ transport system membrane component KefB
VCRLVGWCAVRIGQPQVVAEMVAGFLMGPSFFGWVAPEVQAALFPAPTLRVIFGLPCWLAARLTGVSNRDALGVATLMNARGMMELILLNIGLQRGLITPTFFTILVMMAIGTTLMATPMFNLVFRGEPAVSPDSNLALEKA